MKRFKTHLWVPDTQVKPGDVTDHIRWAGYYVADKKPDAIILGGDWFDMPSLSSYDKGKKGAEGERIDADLDAGWEALEIFEDPWYRSRTYSPRKVALLGNHEQRLARHIDDNPNLDGLLNFPGSYQWDYYGWEVPEYLEYYPVDGIYYTHYFVNDNTGKPLGGVMSTRIKNVGFSATMGHQQTLDQSIRYLGNGTAIRGLVAGAFYIEDQGYKGVTNKTHFRGMIFKTEVNDGFYHPIEVNLSYLCERYEGMTIGKFLRKYYPNKTGSLWEAK